MRWEVLEKVRCVKIAWIIFHYEVARIAGFFKENLYYVRVKETLDILLLEDIINLPMDNKVSKFMKNYVIYSNNIHTYIYVVV